MEKNGLEAELSAPKWLPVSEPRASRLICGGGEGGGGGDGTPGFASDDVHPSFGVTGSHVG